MSDISLELSFEEKKELAKSRKTSPDILAKLSDDPNIKIKEIVASNPKTPQDVLRKLANLSGDEYVWMRYMIASNHSAPVDVLRKLANDDYLCVRDGVATNPNTPLDIILHFVVYDESEYLKDMASNIIKSRCKKLRFFK